MVYYVIISDKKINSMHKWIKIQWRVPLILLGC